MVTRDYAEDTVLVAAGKAPLKLVNEVRNDRQFIRVPEERSRRWRHV
jgi:hypothetical protein